DRLPVDDRQARRARRRVIRAGRRALRRCRLIDRRDRSEAACRRRIKDHASREGLALHAHGARRRGAHRRRGGGPLMLLALANWIAGDVRTFNVFSYITLRAVLATMTALIISFVVGPRMIRKL